MRRILGNVFSNWAGLVVSAIIAFVISPIIVNTLGKEIYGTWTLIVSITGYFTVLDFGVNTAIVRYVSSAVAKRDISSARSIYSTSMAIFGSVSLVILLFSIIFGYFLPDIFGIHQVTRGYLYAVFIVSAIDLSSGLLFSVYQGSLVALQEFKFINGTAICINIVRSIILVFALKNGAGLLTLAFLQLGASIVRAAFQYVLLRKKYEFLKVDRRGINRTTVKRIYSYSVYSFVIAVALKLLFYTDSVVIAAQIGVAAVAFYAIPSTLLDYLEKFVWAMISVLVPVISTNQAQGDDARNTRLYILGTRYSLLISLPIVISLFVYGDDFIRLWMGPEFGEKCRWVLRFLLIGFSFSFSQLIAHGILKGTSRHKVLAYIMAIEAFSNLVMSVVLAKPYGIEGVAIGTMIPLIIASLTIVFYTCRILSLPLLPYLWKSYGGAVIGVGVAFLMVYKLGDFVATYMELVVYSTAITLVYLAVALPLALDRDHRDQIFLKLKLRLDK